MGYDHAGIPRNAYSIPAKKVTGEPVDLNLSNNCICEATEANSADRYSDRKEWGRSPWEWVEASHKKAMEGQWPRQRDEGQEKRAESVSAAVRKSEASKHSRTGPAKRCSSAPSLHRSSSSSRSMRSPSSPTSPTSRSSRRGSRSSLGGKHLNHRHHRGAARDK